MNMKRLLGVLIPGPIEEYFLDLRLRLRNLETVIDTLLESPRYVASEDAGFNGQHFRKKLFEDLLSVISIEGIVETGTWIGDTTGFMAETSGCPVHTAEANRQLYLLSKKRLAHLSNIHFKLSDSRKFLKELTHSDIVHQCTFFYLDAHWYRDLPLYEEIDLIAAHWRRFVVMVDDFRVAGDDGYGYDNYGKGKVLALECIAELVRKHSLAAFFPAIPSSMETGTKRGCVVIVKEGEYSSRLSKLGSLKRAVGFA